MSPAYDRGMLEAARAGAIDGAGVMIRRDRSRLGELLATGIDVGLHLEASGDDGIGDGELADQLAAFEDAAGRPPDYLDGHHHCHAGRSAELVARTAAARALPVRSVDAGHRRLLREHGVATSDLLVGRYEEDEPVLPAELARPPAGITSIEWMVHPGHADARSGSSYDAGREEDLAAVLAFRPRRGMERARRSTRERARPARRGPGPAPER
jgi:predicted glycoside hydrolase/deacetylase ChbG (UPF0249 family)